MSVVTLAINRPAFAQDASAATREVSQAHAERVFILSQTAATLAEPQPRVLGVMSLAFGVALLPLAAVERYNGLGVYEALALAGSATMVGGGIAAFLVDDPFRAERLATASILGGEGLLFIGMAFLRPPEESDQARSDGFFEGPAIAGAGLVAAAILHATDEHPGRSLVALRDRLATPASRAHFTPDDLAIAEASLRLAGRRRFLSRRAMLPLAIAGLLDLGLAINADPTERAIDLVSAGLMGVLVLLSLPEQNPFQLYTAALQRARLTLSPSASPSAFGVSLTARY